MGPSSLRPRRGSPAYRNSARLLKAWAAAALVAAAAAAAEAAPPRLLLLGDSLTAGYGLPERDAFPARLGAALRARGVDAAVLDAGVSGDTTAGGLARLDWALADRPTHALVALGANDALRGIDPATTRGNLDRLVAGLKRAGVKVLLAGMLAPPNLGPAYGEAFRALYREIARKHGIDLYPFFLEGVAARPSLNQEDGIHPNAAGVAVIVERILPRVVRLVGGPE